MPEMIATGAQDNATVETPLSALLDSPDDSEVTGTEGVSAVGGADDKTSSEGDSAVAGDAGGKDAGPGDAAEAASVDPIAEARNEINELRQMLRESRREISLLKARQGTQDAREASRKTAATSGGKQKQDDFLDDDGEGSVAAKPGEEPEVKISRLEELNNQLQQIAAERTPQLETLLAQMRLTDTYKDVDTVCSKPLFDDFVEAVAKRYSDDTGTPMAEAILEVESSIWKLPNPYEYVYGNIKKYHPAFAKKAAASDETGKGKGKETTEKKREQKPAEAPSSLGNIGGGDAGIKGAWTEARINALPETELHTVPKDIYDKYMRNELP